MFFNVFIPQVKYKLSGGRTKSTRHHLQMTHKKGWSGMKEEDEAKGVSKQQTIKEILERRTKVDPKSDLQKNVNRLLLELIGTNFLTFSLFNSPEFYNFFCIPQQNIQYHDSPCLQEGHEQLCKGHHFQGDPATDRFL